MTLYARTDIARFANPACPDGPHHRGDNEHHLRLDCAVCEPVARLNSNIWAEDPDDVPLTKAEVVERKRQERAAKERRAQVRERLLAIQERRLRVEEQRIAAKDRALDRLADAGDGELDLLDDDELADLIGEPDGTDEPAEVEPDPVVKSAKARARKSA